MNTTVAVVLPAWTVMLIAILCAVSIIETTVRACNAALSGRLERQIRKNAADANAKPKGCTHYAIVGLPGEGRDLNWSDAKAWAAEQGGELPSRPMQTS